MEIICLSHFHPPSPLRAERLVQNKVYIIHLCRVTWGDVEKSYLGPPSWVSESVDLGWGSRIFTLNNLHNSHAVGLLWDTALELCIVFGTKCSIILYQLDFIELIFEVKWYPPPQSRFLGHVTTRMAIFVLFLPKPKEHVPYPTSPFPSPQFLLSFPLQSQLRFPCRCCSQLPVEYTWKHLNTFLSRVPFLQF